MAWNPTKPVRYLLQAFNYAVFMALVWYFSAAPAVRLLAEDEAVLTIAFAHAGQLREPCRRLTQEELNQLAPNMRKLEDCPRERSPVTIEALVDGELVYRDVLDPPGLFDDGGVDVYFSTKIPAGEHMLTLRMNDSVRVEGFIHELGRSISVNPTQVLLVGFDKEQGFVFHDIDG
jgi:hypothetical protein